MSNGMHESKVGAAHLQDVDEGTFKRFSQWVYTRSYTAADAMWINEKDLEQKSVDDSTAVCQTQHNDPEQASSVGKVVFLSDGERPTPPQKMSKKCKKKKKQTQEESLQQTELQTLSIDDALESVEPDQMTCIGGIYSKKEQDLRQGTDFTYLEHFLSHARLYVFADQRQIDELAMLTASRLNESLQQFHYYDERAEDIVYLIEYIYENTAILQQRNDKLRHIAVTHVTNHLEDMISSAIFNNLIERGGQFAKDLLAGIAARVNEMKGNIFASPRSEWSARVVPMKGNPSVPQRSMW